MLVIPKWLVGLLRLSLVAFVFSWAGWSLYLIQANARRNQWLVSSQFNPVANPAADLIPSRERWPLVTATPEFQALPSDQRVQFAESFYENNIQGLIKNLDYDEEDIRQWYGRSATMSLSEAPTASLFSRVENKNIPYRIYSSYPRPKLSKDFLNPIVIRATTLTVIAFWGFIAFFFGVYTTFLRKRGGSRKK